MRPDLDSVSEDIAQHLRELPSELPPPFDWTEFRRRERERQWPKRSVVKWQHAAAAAGVTALIAGMAMWGRSDQHAAVTGVNASAVTSAPNAASNDPPAESHQDAQDAREVAARVQATAIMGAQAAFAARRATVARAEASQEWLARQPAEPAVVRVVPRLAVTNLEDRIAWMDDALTEERFGHVDDTRLQALQQERARLVNSLAQVRYAETLASVQ